MTLTSPAERWSLRAAYVAGAGALAAVLATATQAGALPGWLALLIVLLYLGPLGIAALLLVVVPLEMLILLPPLALPVISVVAAVGVAFLNVSIVERWRNGRVRASPPGAPTSRRRDADTLLGGALFVLAGCGFVLLCMFAGFAALTAHGVDAPVPEADAARTLIVAGIAWWTGLAIAIAGLVLWVRRARERRPLLPWAAADLASMVVLIGVVLLA